MSRNTQNNTNRQIGPPKIHRNTRTRTALSWGVAGQNKEPLATRLTPRPGVREPQSDLKLQTCRPKGENTTASQSSRSSRGREVRSKTHENEIPKRQKQEAATDSIHNPTEHQNRGELGRKQKSHQEKSRAINETGLRWTES